MNDLNFFQIGLNTVDLAATLRFYTEVFGFANAGGQAGWGNVMKVQGLEAEGQALCWFMVGRHSGIQLEIFHHTNPLIRPQPADWSPADHGWVRYGFALEDFDGALSRLAERAVPLLGGVVERDGARRFAIRDPYCGIVIEVIEDKGQFTPAMSEPANDCDPLILYATSSVSDLEAARRYYSEILALPLEPIERLHLDGDEGVWGLAGARRTGFLVATANGMLEVVEYQSPRGRVRRADHRLSDQGIMNIGLSSPDMTKIDRVIERLDAEGNPPPWLILGPDLLGTYINDADREIELLSLPEHVRRELGFRPVGQFGGGDFLKMVERDRLPHDDPRRPRGGRGNAVV